MAFFFPKTCEFFCLFSKSTKQLTQRNRVPRASQLPRCLFLAISCILTLFYRIFHKHIPNLVNVSCYEKLSGGSEPIKNEEIF